MGWIMRARARRASAVALGMLLGTASAHADEPSAEDRARLPALLRAGSDATKAKKWDACIEALSAAAAINDAATTWGDLGLCEEAAGRFPDAYKHLRQAMAFPTTAMHSHRPWRGYQEMLTSLTSRVALVIITTFPANARVVIDGRPYGIADGSAIPLSPGTHTFVGRLEGYEDASKTRSMRATDLPSVDLWLTPKDKAVATPVPQAEPKPTVTPVVPSKPASVAPVRKVEGTTVRSIPWCIPNATPRGALMTLACAGLATTVVSGATAIGLEVHLQSLRNKLIAQGYQLGTCGKPGAPPECAQVRDRGGQRMGAVYATITAAVATGVLGGATALAYALDRDPSRPSIALTVGPQGGGIGFIGAW